MSTEINASKNSGGRLEVIKGSMFSGKSEELIRRIRRAEIAKLTTRLFKPSLDNRYGYGTVDSHDGRSHKAIIVDSSADVLKYLNTTRTQVVGIDEAQFLDPEIVDICNYLASRLEMRVIATGLDLDFRAEPFGPMPELTVNADHVDTLHAICMSCFGEASRTQRLISEKQSDDTWKIRPAHYNDPIILVAAGSEHAADTSEKIKEYYEARCRHCHDVPGKPEYSINK